MKIFVSDLILFGYDLILLSYRVQYLSIPLVSILINFGVKNQVPQFSFEIVVGDLMSVLFYEFVDIIFYGYLYIL